MDGLLDRLRVVPVDASEVHATQLGHTDQLVDLTLHGAIMRRHELKIEVGQRWIDPHLLELRDRPRLVVHEPDMAQYDPGYCVEPERVVNATESHADGKHPHGMSTKSGSAVDFPAASPSNFVLDRIAEPQCTQNWAPG